MLIGVIADDFTGASDIAVTLSKGEKGQGGLATTQYLGIPQHPAGPEVEAGVIALKSRSIPAQDAVEQSLAACEWLLEQGCEQIVFKYCSTFDSTDEGNIGPVTDALAQRLQVQQVVMCPSFPAMGRTLYQGHLFVNDKLLNESGMEHHPLTPMKDACLLRVLQRQSRNAVLNIAWQKVCEGEIALRQSMDAAGNGERCLLLVDAICEEDLITIGRASRGVRLLTGGSGIALGLGHNFIQEGRAKGKKTTLPLVNGPEAILVGSCSGATRGQIEEHQKEHPVLMVDVKDVLTGIVGADQLVEFIFRHQGKSPLVYSSGTPESVKKIQQEFGRENVAAALDNLFGETAKKLVATGTRRIIVGGGETSGAVVSALNLHALTIGDEIDIGVPAMVSKGNNPLALALKSGNFGGKDFFSRAVKALQGPVME
ncbi:four-carbon acid sugar kinase family protein [Rouxiella badensis]|uniref:3-oxo-tetronate kinase n=1 Tax=Rouxiella badensis TaxID=1646377 RepID=UPI001D154F26|nr:3-oxo-tetronate kinase [Rouxiella badensis]MCC3705278.1 four-carbon acid sugar kinase family protein [Rouxiella badensis]